MLVDIDVAMWDLKGHLKRRLSSLYTTRTMVSSMNHNNPFQPHSLLHIPPGRRLEIGYLRSIIIVRPRVCTIKADRTSAVGSQKACNRHRPGTLISTVYYTR